MTIRDTFETIETLTAKANAPKIEAPKETKEMKAKRLYGEYQRAKGIKAAKDNGVWHNAR